MPAKRIICAFNRITGSTGPSDRGHFCKFMSESTEIKASVLQRYFSTNGKETRFMNQLKSSEFVLQNLRYDITAKFFKISTFQKTLMSRTQASRSLTTSCSQLVRASRLKAVKQFGSNVAQRIPSRTQISGFHVQLQTQFKEWLILVLKQSNPIVAQRVRRMTQIGKLYSDLGYDHHSIRQIFHKLGKSIIRRLERARKQERPLFVLFSAAAGFNWEENRIKQTEMREVTEEVKLIQKGDDNSRELHVRSNSSALVEWESVMDQHNIKAYRKPIPDSHLFEYKVFGTFHDIPARAFYNAQLDFEFRKKWDKLVVKLDVVERDQSSGTEVVHWITHFPYPMYKREYVYVRRYHVDNQNKIMTIMSRNTDHPNIPVTAQYVRVINYISNMVIKPHYNDFDKNGFDYVLTYYDDPQANIPQMCISWMAAKGVPKFVNDLHDAAKRLHEKLISSVGA